MNNNYKKYFKRLGDSDIASLILVGPTDKGLESHILKMGEDGDYRAWVIDGTSIVPSHYGLEKEFSHWLRIYDDDTKTGEFDAEIIRIYRAGEMGILIQLVNPKEGWQENLINW